MGFVNEILENFDRRTVDKKRDITLVRTGTSHPDYPTEFSLTIKGDSLTFEAIQRTEQLDNGKSNVYWDVINVLVPREFDHSKDNILETIEASLIAYGFAASTQNVEKTQVSIAPQVSI
jgi:hypothetical protein|tara:strand:- start:890 stop:1246 length:357 start_codon:yes stop_codon:yes gene_type:complete